MIRVHKHENKWWFWDETDSNRIGPYNSEKEADEGEEGYGKYLMGNTDDEEEEE